MENNKIVNRTIEYIKLVAACFVVFIHYSLGLTIDAIARFAVPFFFAVSGYFSYRIYSKHIEKRVMYISKLLFFATIIYTIDGAFNYIASSQGQLSSYIFLKFNLKQIARWLFLNENPVGFHLWYLNAMLTCYIIFWLYTKFNEREDENINYSSFYNFCFILLAIHFMWSIWLVISSVKVDLLIIRNGLFFGLPVFGIGLFIRENFSMIREKFRMSELKCFNLILFGVVGGILQHRYLGKSEMPIGMFLVTCALLMFAIIRGEKEVVSKSKDKIANIIGNTSMIVYIIHVLCSHIIKFLAKTYPFINNVVQNERQYSFVVLIMSVVIGIVASTIYSSYRLIKQHKSI